MTTSKHFRKIDDFNLNPCGLYILKKRIDQLENLIDIARHCEMPKTLEQLHLAAKIIADKISTLEEAAQAVLIQYERETWPPPSGIEAIDEETAELVEKLADAF